MFFRNCLLALYFIFLAKPAFASSETKEAELRNLLQLDPTNVAVLTEISDLYLLNGNLKNASLVLEAALTYAPERNDLRRKLALLFEAEGETEKSLEQNLFILNQLPAANDTLQLTVKQLSSLKQYSKATEVLNRAIRAEPQESNLYLIRAKYLSKQKLFDAAFKDLQMAVKLKPNDPSLWVSVGSAFEETGLYEDAIKSYQRAQSLGDTSEETFYKLARLRSGKKEYQNFLKIKGKGQDENVLDWLEQ